jgi:hypothetical protein
MIASNWEAMMAEVVECADTRLGSIQTGDVSGFIDVAMEDMIASKVS